MRYYISDLHFFHKNMNTQMDCRGFDSMEEMNSYMIKKWNSKVRQNDEVVILGDFSMGSGKETMDLLSVLKGKKYLITGNHDRFIKERRFVENAFVWIKPYAEMHDDGRKVVLSHYPIFCYNGQYRYDKNGKPKTYMLYGHVHDTEDEKLLNFFKEITRSKNISVKNQDALMPLPCNMYNCFCMYSDYEPLTLDEWLELYNKGTPDKMNAKHCREYLECEMQKNRYV